MNAYLLLNVVGHVMIMCDVWRIIKHQLSIKEEVLFWK